MYQIDLAHCCTRAQLQLSLIVVHHHRNQFLKKFKPSLPVPSFWAKRMWKGNCLSHIRCYCQIKVVRSALYLISTCLQLKLQQQLLSCAKLQNIPMHTHSRPLLLILILALVSCCIYFPKYKEKNVRVGTTAATVVYRTLQCTNSQNPPSRPSIGNPPIAGGVGAPFQNLCYIGFIKISSILLLLLLLLFLLFLLLQHRKSRPLLLVLSLALVYFSK